MNREKIKYFVGMGVMVSLLKTTVQAASLQTVSEMQPALISSGGGGDSVAPILSADGRFVLFASTANNLATNINGLPFTGSIPTKINVFLRDRNTKQTTLVTINAAGDGGGNGDSNPIEISADNRYALFESSAGNLVVGDVNKVNDIFVRNL